MVSRSRGIRPLSRRGDTGSWLRTWSSVSAVDALERGGCQQTACQQVVQQRSQGVNISGGADRAGKGGHLFGGHVRGGPLGAVGPGLGGSGLAFEAGDAEVGNLGGDAVPGGPRLAIEQDVGRFQVEVGHPAGVEVAHGAGDDLGEPGGVAGGSGSVNRSLSVPPGTYSRTRQSQSSVSSTRWIATTWSCGTRESAALGEPVHARVRIDQRVSREQLHGDVAFERGFPDEVDHACGPPAQHALDDEAGNHRRSAVGRRGASRLRKGPGWECLVRRIDRLWNESEMWSGEYERVGFELIERRVRGDDGEQTSLVTAGSVCISYVRDDNNDLGASGSARHREFRIVCSNGTERVSQITADAKGDVWFLH